MMKKKIVLLSALISAAPIYAQDIGIVSGAQNLLDQVRTATPIILALAFLISALFNIGKITGSDRDYKSFFIGILLWVAGIGAVLGIFNYILTITV